MPLERHSPIPITGPERLNSWKEIADYLRISVRTAQRWERSEGLPVHRHQHDASSTVYANRAELVSWLTTRHADRDISSSDGAARRFRLAGFAALALLGACLVSAFILFARGSRPDLASNYRQRPFATGLPSQWFPTWSPDGKKIGYIGEKGGNRRLMVQAIDSPHPFAISPPALQLADRQFPFWSPDSQWVYCIGTLDGGSEQVEASLYRVPAAGGDPVLVQPATRAATVSPDGKTLVTLSRSGDGNWRILTATPPEGLRQLYQPEPIRAGVYLRRPTLTFAPRGDRIFLAIYLPSQEPQHWLLPWPPGTPRLLPNPRLGSLNFAWMPDSQHLLALGGNRRELLVADTESGRFSPLVKLDRRPAYPTVSPDGTRLAYQSQLSHADVIAVPIDGGPIRPVLDSSATEEMPSCSNVSDNLVYVTDRRGPNEVWLHNLNDSSSRPLFAAGPAAMPGTPTAGAPAFSRNGRQIAVRVGLSASESGIVVASAQGGSPARVVVRAPLLFAPTWSPDGEWIAFVQLIRDTYHLMKAATNGPGSPIDLAVMTRRQGDPVPMSPPEWSPAGNWIAFEDDRSQLTLISPDGMSRRRLGSAGPVAWAHDGRTVYQLRYDDRALAAIDVATARHSVLRHLGDAMPYAFTEPGRRVSLARDGKSVIYSVLRPRDEIWLLEGLRPHPPWYTRLWRW